MSWVESIGPWNGDGVAGTSVGEGVCVKMLSLGKAMDQLRFGRAPWAQAAETGMMGVGTGGKGLTGEFLPLISERPELGAIWVRFALCV